MKKIILITLLLLFSLNLFAFFGDKDGKTKSKKSTDIISIKMSPGNWLYFPKQYLVVLLDENEKTVTLAYGPMMGPDGSGNDKGKIVTWPFRSKEGAQQFMKSIYPDAVCLNGNGIVKCDYTDQLKTEPK
jgi:hypothetical protein